MLKQYLPILTWLPKYNRSAFSSDLVAAVIVTILLIPQSLAYALLAGLPAETGLYASILPLVAYCLFGTSRTLSVGPAAIIALMIAAATSNLATPGTMEYVTAAVTLAFVSGLILCLMGLLRLGFMANFLSHPVISGFVTASAILIAVGQLGSLLGLKISGTNLPFLLGELFVELPNLNLPTLAIGSLALAILFWCRRWLARSLVRLGLNDELATLLAKGGPILAVLITSVVVWGWELSATGVKVVGEFSSSLSGIVLPSTDLELWRALLVPALLISIVGFVESVSIAQTLAAKRRQRIRPDQELIGLGAANLGAAVSGGFPVTGSFSRSVINFDAGAATPAAGAFAAVGIALAVVFLTPLMAMLPQATLAATIIVAILSLVDIDGIKRYWSYSKKDFYALLGTLIITLLIGVEVGILSGIGLSLAFYLYQTSRPHTAVVGQISGTEHFRNINRHQVETAPHILLFRIDEGLFFANSRFLEDRLYTLVAQNPELTDIVLICSAINYIDGSALESLETINQRLQDSGVRLHLSEVKGPVMDRLQRTSFPQHLSGEIFLTTYAAWRKLQKQPGKREPDSG